MLYSWRKILKQSFLLNKHVYGCSLVFKRGPNIDLKICSQIDSFQLLCFLFVPKRDLKVYESEIISWPKQFSLYIQVFLEFFFPAPCTRILFTFYPDVIRPGIYRGDHFRDLRLGSTWTKIIYNYLNVGVS